MRGLERRSQQLHKVWWEKEESDKGWLVREREGTDTERDRAS